MVSHPDIQGECLHLGNTCPTGDLNFLNQFSKPFLSWTKHHKEMVPEITHVLVELLETNKGSFQGALFSSDPSKIMLCLYHDISGQYI